MLLMPEQQRIPISLKPFVSCACFLHNTPMRTHTNTHTLSPSISTKRGVLTSRLQSSSPRGSNKRRDNLSQVHSSEDKIWVDLDCRGVAGAIKRVDTVHR